MKHIGREDGLDGMADGVSEVDEVAETGEFALVVGHDVGFDGDGAYDDG